MYGRPYLLKFILTSGLLYGILRLFERKEEMTDKIAQIKELWASYKAYLQDKYPAKEGEKWEFTCEYHKGIDAIFERKEE